MWSKKVATALVLPVSLTSPKMRKGEKLKNKFIDNFDQKCGIF
jgi:hypothetical protein